MNYLFKFFNNYLRDLFVFFHLRSTLNKKKEKKKKIYNIIIMLYDFLIKNILYIQI